MKKSLLALVALGAFAGVAQAQSSVTVYGTLDAGFRRDDTGSNLNGVTTGLVSNTLTSDRLGFRGTEDLGGGNRAFFQLETGMVPFTNNNGRAGAGAGYATDNNTPGSFVTTRRESFLGLTDSKLGTLQVGSMYSLGFNFSGYGDATGTNILGTDVSHATVVSNATDTAAATSVGGTTSSFKMNANSQKYISPRISGVQATLYTVTNVASANGAGKVAAAELDYVLGKLEARAMYEVKQVATSAASNTITKHTTMGIAAKYDLGVVKLGISTQKGDLVSTVANVVGQTGTVTVNKFTAIAPASPVVDIWGGYVTLSENAAGSLYSNSGSTATAAYMVAGATYKLSKRTNIYAYYAGMDNKETTAKFGRGSAVGTATFDPSSMGVGMRHSF